MSGLDFQVVDIEFNKGLDTKTQDKLVVPGKFTALENLTLSEDYSLKRRDGCAALVATANGNGLATYGSQLLTINGGAVSSVSQGTASVVAVSGTCGYVGVAKTEVRRTTGFQDDPDCASNGTFTCYVWRERNQANTVTGVSVTVIDEATGALLQNAASMRSSATVFTPRVVFAGGAFFIFYIDGGVLRSRVILASSPTALGAEGSLVAISLASINFDACAFGANSAMVAYGWADGVTSVQTIQVTQAGGNPSVAAGPTNIFTEVQKPIATITGICCAAYSDGVTAAVFATSTGAAAMAGLAGRNLNTSWATTGAAVQLDAAVAATATNVHVTAVINDSSPNVGLQVFYDRQSEWGTNAFNPVRSAVFLNNGAAGAFGATIFNSATFGAGTTARGPQGPFIAGKAFSYGGRMFLPVFVGSVYNALSSAASNPRTANTQNTFFLMDVGATGSLFAIVGTPVVVAKALYGTFGLASINGTAPAICTPCSVINPSSGKFSIVASELTLLVLSSGNNISPTGLVRLDFTPVTTTPLLKTQLGESTYLASGSLSTYDGAQVVEHGFPLFPEGAAIAVNGGGTGSMTAGVHQVVFIYEWVDNAGQRHQSAPSLPISVTNVATGSLTCVVPTLLLSQKSSIQVVAFMTQAGGITFNRVLLNAGTYSPVVNTTAATTVTLTISDADATIAGNEVLYTQPNQAGSTLPNVAPGPIGAFAVIHNRLFYGKADQTTQFGYTQEYVNDVGLQFNRALGGALPADGGNPTAFSALDEKVIIFSEDRIFVVFGTGPTSSGGYNNYSEPQDIQSDVGCIEPRSVVSDIPGGIIFKSRKGWYVLGRDLATHYIGDGVAAYDDYEVRSGVLVGDKQEVRFAVRLGVEAGLQLVYSYLTDQWSTYRKSSGGDYLINDAVWWKTIERYVTISTSNGLNKDTPGVFEDAPGVVTSAPIAISFTTAWLHLSKLEGFQRVRRVYITAENDSGGILASTLTLDVNFDDVPALAATGAYTATIQFTTTAAVIDVRHKLRRMKCKSVSFSLSEVAASSGRNPLTGIQAIALEIGFKKGVNKLSAAQTME